MRPTRALLAAWMTLILAWSASAEEVEHPTYKSWAGHPLGTSVTIRTLTANPASTLTTTTTTTLRALKPDRVVLEIRRVSDATGTKVEHALETYDQRRMFPLLPGVKKEDIGKPIKPIATGEETLKVGDREIKASWSDSKGQSEAGDTTTRTWMSDEVPGRIVKVVTKIPKASTTITRELIELKTPTP